MLRNYFITALRVLGRNPGYTLLNLIGLGVGVACGLLVLLYVQHEWSYDQFHAHADRIFRVNLVVPVDERGATEQIDMTPSLLAPAFRRSIPEVETAVRFYKLSFQGRKLVVRQGDRRYLEHRVYMADSTVFDVFSFPLLHGEAASALVRPGTVVLTASMARKYFDTEAPIGQTIEIGSSAFEVTGVMRDVPTNAHFHPDFIASLEGLRNQTEWFTDTEWQSANFVTYLLVRPGANVARLEQKLDAYAVQQQDADRPVQLHLRLEALTRIHLYPQVLNQYEPQGSIQTVQGAILIGVLILLAAAINYTNLSTARAARRAREIGVRKVVGAHQWQLVGQYLAESLMVALLAMVLAVLLVWLTLPSFAALIGTPLTQAALFTPASLGGLLLIGTLTGLMAGAYPAVLLSAFRPASVLKSGGLRGQGNTRLRQALVVVQFAVSVFLGIGALVIHEQLRFVQQQNLGFARDELVFMELDWSILPQIEALKQEVLRDPRLTAASAVSQVPGAFAAGYSVTVEGQSGDAKLITGVPIDRDALRTMGLKVIQGRDAPPDHRFDEQNYLFWVNETGARYLGLAPEKAVDVRVMLNGRTGRIAGVVQDFHFASLHQAIAPVIFFIQPFDLGLLMVRVKGPDVRGAMVHLEGVWKQFMPDRPFDPTFLNSYLDDLYRADVQTGRVVLLFTGLALLIACLGLFGLAAYAAEQRTKEIGIRKVMGATVADLVALLSREFVLLVGVAVVLSAPVAWWVMHHWLAGFAYRIALGPLVFVLAGGLALAIALATVGTQALRAALADPVKSLRYE